MSSATVAEAKSRFSDLLRRAEYGGERIVVHRHGKPVAAIVSTADLERLEALEDARDVADARVAIKEAEQEGTTALEDVLKKHHLEHLLGASSGTGKRPAAGPVSGTSPAPHKSTQARRPRTGRRRPTRDRR